MLPHLISYISNSWNVTFRRWTKHDVFLFVLFRENQMNRRDDTNNLFKKPKKVAYCRNENKENISSPGFKRANGTNFPVRKIPNGANPPGSKIPNVDNSPGSNVPNESNLPVFKIANGANLPGSKIPKGGNPHGFKIPNGVNPPGSKIPNESNPPGSKSPSGSTPLDSKSPKGPTPLDAKYPATSPAPLDTKYSTLGQNMHDERGVFQKLRKEPAPLDTKYPTYGSKFAWWRRGVSKISEKVLTLFMDGPLTYLHIYYVQTEYNRWSTP